MKKLLFLLGVILFLACNPKQVVYPPNNIMALKKPYKAPKNIILMIGDGMGISQITAGMIINGNQLALEKFPVTGLHKCNSADNLITDSAAGATAFACGQKTYNSAIAVNTDTLPLKTILEEAEDKGLATGMVATSTIVHATPACFIAHNKYRRNYEEIAEDFLKTDIDFFLAGGKRFFEKREKDNRNLISELKEKGYHISDFAQEKLRDLKINPDKPFGYFTDDGDPSKVREGRDYLPLASSKAISFLDKRGENGFFLMIEGSQIDWGGHASDADYIITEMIDFDKAIANALEFAKADKETLIIVTADHETGGFAINPGSTRDSIIGGFTTMKHTGTLIPVFAYGPGAELFSGIYENTDIYHKMKACFGWQ